MASVCFVVDTLTSFEIKNYMILGNAAFRLGYDTYMLLSDTLSLSKNIVSGRCYKMTSEITTGEGLEAGQVRELNSMEFCWVLSFGRRENFLDVIQMHWIASKSTTYINSPQSLMFLNNKYVVPLLCETYPATYASSDFEFLWEAYTAASISKWVVKPPAGSLGRDVFILQKGDINARSILQTMTDHAKTKYCLLQEYVPGILNGEKRVIMVGEEIICWYIPIAIENANIEYLH
ncbi:MAG: hypothetical protein GKR94_25725 [Gammaproteobacteria bacterium]|nr:hypothetical protein [Gammaproteobacteria bacterium]